MAMNKRVILMTPSMCKGGAETQLLKVALYLKSKQYDVMLISLKPINEFEIDLEEQGLSVVFLKNWFGHAFSNCVTLYKTVKAFKPDVVLAFMFIAIIFARLLKLRFHFKLISTIRISVINKKWYIPFKMTSGLDDMVVYNSNASKANFERWNLVRKEGIVINNAISIPVLNGMSPNVNYTQTFNWVCVGHFKYNKDYPTLFKAIALLKDKIFQVNIVGKLNNEVWPYKMIEDLGIQNHVNILGFKQNTSDYITNAEAFILSSYSEGMPNAVLEAMAHAKPIVVTAIDVNKELVDAAHCGFLTEKENEKHLAGKMLEMMNMTATQRKVFGQNGKTYIQSNFSDKSVMDSWMQLINQFAS
ncbi:glycosyltransferase [Pedobacter nyackensis]|uniref:Glycosyltransferase involved in cell wall bisynthesis n=1 Tax=Pedobacter nyackensis TaxID=475255 RepID=A0A1W2DDF2_9SPHI|nr:glycosyltransferase [Pedobacter nyackensis]SMC95172.1 Glycosyltransferase involved in cell wall bisynthesis [Pedobacter nyackensis]